MKEFKKILVMCFVTSISGSCINYLDDPCSPKRYTSLNEYTRSAAYHDSNSSMASDSSIREGWYRSTSPAGEDMPLHTPKNGYCQAIYPAWLRGSLPGVAEGIVRRTVCVTGFNSNCSQTINICVKNCVNYNVYYLYKPTDVRFRYCFGSELPCQSGFRSPNGFTPGCKGTVKYVEPPALCYSTTNPCDANNHKIWDDPDRNVNHPYISQAEDSLLMEGWYRAKEPAGVDMSTKNLGPFACQSFSPIWLNGTLPNVKDGIVQIPACVPKVLEPTKCIEILQICVKNCGKFYTHFLKRPTGTFGRYCFETSKKGAFSKSHGKKRGSLDSTRNRHWTTPPAHPQITTAVYKKTNKLVNQAEKKKTLQRIIKDAVTKLKEQENPVVFNLKKPFKRTNKRIAKKILSFILKNHRDRKITGRKNQIKEKIRSYFHTLKSLDKNKQKNDLFKTVRESVPNREYCTTLVSENKPLKVHLARMLKQAGCKKAARIMKGLMKNMDKK